MAVKAALRKLIRDPNPPYKLRVAFVDSVTGQIVTDLTGYTILDQGTNVDVPAPGAGGNNNPPPSDNNNGGPYTSGGGGQAYDGAQDYSPWGESTYKPSRGSGNIFEDFGIMFDRTKRKVQDFTDAIKEQIIPGSTGRVNKTTGLTDIPPMDGSAAKPRDPNTIRDPLGESTASIGGSSFVSEDHPKSNAVQKKTPFVSEDRPTSNVSDVKRQPTGSANQNLTQARSEQQAASGRSMPTGRDVLSSLGGSSDNVADLDPVTTTPGFKSPDAAVDYVNGRNISYNPDSIAIRKQPVQPEVRDAVAAAIKATNPNITMSINSGGQEPLGSKDAKAGVNRTSKPTTNHDVVNGKSYALDGQFFLDGKQITPASHPEIFKEIAKNAVIAGATQIGMGGGIVHIGKDPTDDHVKTWGYDSAGNVIAMPKAIAEGIKEGKAILANDPAAGDKLLGGIAPIPATKSDAISRANAARVALGFTPITMPIIPPAKAAVSPPIPLPRPSFDPVTSTPAPKTATTKDGKTVEIGKVYDIGGNKYEGKVDANGVGYIEKLPVDIIASEAGKNTIVGGIIKREADKQLGAAVGNIGTQLTEAAPGALDAAKGTVDSVIAGAGNLFGGLGGMFGGGPPASTNQNLDQAKSEQKGLMKRGIDAVGGTASLGTNPLADPVKRDKIVGTILGEAVGEGPQGMLAVANVIKNRAMSGVWDSDPYEVVTQPFQFSANNPGAGGNNIAKRYPPGTPEYNEALKIAEAVFNGVAPDPTNGSVYYFNPNVANPSWASGLGAPLAIGNHNFYPTRPESIMSRPETKSATTPTGSSITPSQRSAIAGTNNQSLLRAGSSAVGGGSTYSGATTPTGSAITSGQRSAIADTSGIMSRPSSGSDSTYEGATGPTTSSSQRVTSPTGGSITTAQRNAISSTSGSETTIGSSGISSSESERRSAASSGSSAVGGGGSSSGSSGVMRSPTSSASTPTRSSSPSPIVSGSSAVGSAGGRTTSPSQTVTTSSGGTITKAQSDAIRRL